jgi:hypothetical protein
VQITKERRKRVIDLYFNQHKSYAEIAEIERISPRDIHAILNEEEAKRQKYKDQQQQEEISSKAYKLFFEKKSTVEVAVALNLREPEVTKLYREYWRLKGLHKLNSIYQAIGGKLGTFLKLYRLMKEKGMNIAQVVNAVDIAIHKLPYMENLYVQAKDQAEKMQCTIRRLANDIEERKTKISILDKIAFSSEQYCKREELAIQELSDKKNRLEKWITNILNGEGYSKLKQVAKENVKAVLSDNKILISIAFAAVIQTLKDDSQMVNLIYNIPAMNNGEQHKNNNNKNIANYLQANKNALSDLAEKHYENLVEALTNEVINTAAAASSSLSNRTSLPSSSSSTFLGRSDQSDISKTEKEGIFHNSKGDIAD